MSINKNAALFLSDGTRVNFESTTSRGNIRVIVPAGHPLADGQGNGRIFDPRTGRSTKGSTTLTLTNTAPTAAARGDIDVNAPLFLSDGTPVTFVKWTAKRRIQVRLPDGHPFAVGQENGRIFFRESGKHFKGRTDLVLSNTAPASVGTSTSAPATAAAGDATFSVVSASGSVLGEGYASAQDAANAAVAMLSDGSPLNIVRVTSTVVGTVSATIALG